MRIWLLILTGIAALWLTLVASGYGILVRDDPMAVSDANIVTDAACTYFDGRRTETVFLHDKARTVWCPRWRQLRS